MSDTLRIDFKLSHRFIIEPTVRDYQLPSWRPNASASHAEADARLNILRDAGFVLEVTTASEFQAIIRRLRASERTTPQIQTYTYVNAADLPRSRWCPHIEAKRVCCCIAGCEIQADIEAADNETEESL